MVKDLLMTMLTTRMNLTKKMPFFMPLLALLPMLLGVQLFVPLDSELLVTPLQVKKIFFEKKFREKKKNFWVYIKYA